MSTEVQQFLTEVGNLPEDKPDTSEGLGQKLEFKQINLELSSHPGASFTVDDNEAEIKIKTPNPIKTTFKLLYKGFYKFYIFALPASDPGNSYPCVFTYLIEVTNVAKDVCCYPKQYSPWPSKGCLLYSPLCLDPGQPMDHVQFKVYVPSAKRVAVKAGDEWTHLDKCEDDIWQGKVYLEHYRGKNVPVRINAGWDEESSTYESLLEYTI
ncbi:hypothetical protein BaRGS_00014071 [Batillaria attramentaria]|uniref:Uncharacterized protein n=1 Tax=Batillaria attramentaria TaxID=370345 RepID=A0ABD0L618_9CAEN